MNKDKFKKIFCFQKNKPRKIALFFLIFLLIFPFNVLCKEELHPHNKKLVASGVMPYPKYVPSVPRIMADTALMLYNTGRAQIAWIGADGALVKGAYHFRGNNYEAIHKQVRLSKGQILLLYCS